MIEIKKNKNEMGLFDFEIINNEKKLNILYGGNGDLYFYVNKYNLNEKEQTVNFEITKENYILFSLFEELYNKIINCNIYKIDNVELEILDEDEIDEKINLYKNWNNELKRKSSYVNLVQNGVISWKHDEQIYEEANILNIYKEKEQYRLEFILNNKELSHYIDIRFRNSGSRYQPFNQPFMDLYNALQKYDLEYHQMHIEEYFYQKRLEKVKKKVNF